MPTGHWMCRGAKAIPLGVDPLTTRPITSAGPVPLRAPLGCNVNRSGPPTLSRVMRGRDLRLAAIEDGGFGGELNLETAGILVGAGHARSCRSGLFAEILSMLWAVVAVNRRNAGIQACP